MRLTPLDIREQEFRRVMRGLDPDEVQAFLAAVAGEFETLVASNNELRQRVVELEEKIVEYRSMEKALRDTLLTAEKVMGDAKESAQREAQLVIREAELAAQRARARVAQDVQQLEDRVVELRRLKDAYLSRVRWLLRSHLELLDGHAQEFSELDASLPAAPALPAGPLQPPADLATRSLPPAPPAVQPWVAPAESVLPPGPDLGDVLRAVRPDGSYDPGSEPPLRDQAATPEDLARAAARRAERLAAEARAALERHQAPPRGWNGESFREDPEPRP